MSSTNLQRKKGESAVGKADDDVEAADYSREKPVSYCKRKHSEIFGIADVAEKASTEESTGKPEWDAQGQEVVTSKEKYFSALFYALSSLAVIFLNKTIMSHFEFPHFNFLATIQFVATTAVLLFLQGLNKIEIPNISLQTLQDILPISLMFLGNIVAGLGSTKNLSLPMFTALRRFSILMTMWLEWYIIGNKPTKSVLITVGMMVGGAVIASMYDIAFDTWGYSMVFANNIFTALNGVFMKKALSSTNLKNNKLGVLFYNSLFSALVMLVYFSGQDLYTRYSNATHGFADDSALMQSSLKEVLQFEGWSNPWFLILFIVAAFLGSVLNYSIFLCTSFNSALTTAVIGCLKNVITSYLGMIFFTDFNFSWPNFIGINISIIGSLLYTKYTIFGATPIPIKPSTTLTEKNTNQVENRV